MINKLFFKYSVAALLMLAIIAIFPSCSEDKKEDPIPAPVADFEFAISETNYLEVTFTNLSQNATSYAWTFGDTGNSTDENPTYTYNESGTFTVTLVATNSEGATSSKEQSVEIINPDVALDFIAGDVSRKWILQREGVTLGIYSSAGEAWWEYKGGVTERSSVVDDEITFFKDGSVEVDTKNTVWLDTEANGGWNDNLGEGNHNEDESGLWVAADNTDVSDFANGGDYSFVIEDDMMTVSGSGFYIGLSSKTNDGDNPFPISSKVYEVTKMIDGDGVDSLQLVMHINNDGGKWIFNLVSYDDFSQAPVIPPPPPLVSELSLDHETDVPWEVFGGSVVEIIDNPDKTGINTSNKVLKLLHGNETWAGINTEIGGRLETEGKTKLKVKIWTAKVGTLKYKLEVPNGPSQELDIEVNEINKWVELEWDLTTDNDGKAVRSGYYTKVVLFPGWDTTDTSDVYFIDDIVME